VQVRNEIHDNVRSSELDSGRLQHGLRKCAVVADITEDANATDNHTHQQHVKEINCVG